MRPPIKDADRITLSGILDAARNGDSLTLTEYEMDSLERIRDFLARPTSNTVFDIVKSKNLIKQEGLVLRHLLRLVILSGEFFTRTQDPDYQRIAEQATHCCRVVDPRYTDRFLADAEAAKKLIQV